MATGFPKEPLRQSITSIVICGPSCPRRSQCRPRRDSDRDDVRRRRLLARGRRGARRTTGRGGAALPVPGEEAGRVLARAGRRRPVLPVDEPAGRRRLVHGAAAPVASSTGVVTAPPTAGAI